MIEINLPETGKINCNNINDQSVGIGICLRDEVAITSDLSVEC